MSNEKFSRVLNLMRDYGIIVLTLVIILLAIEYYRHDYRVATNVVPAVSSSIEQISTNTKMIDNNTLMIDSLRMELRRVDSVLKVLETAEKIHHPHK